MQAAVLPIENLRIMLVDDDDSVREVLTEMLSKRGWMIDGFASAESAISALKHERYGVILTDINMPGLSGMDFLHLAREYAPDAPVVMITGYPSIDLAVEAIKFGAVDFLQKPFKAEELEIVIRKAVGASERAPGPAGMLIAAGGQHGAARKRLEDKIKELSILHTISESLDEVTGKDDIFRKTMDIAQIIADADMAFIMVVEHDNGRLVVRAASGYDASDVLGTEFPLADEPFRSVLDKKCYSYLLAQPGSLAGLVPQGGPLPVLLAPLIINREAVVILGLAGRPGAPEISGDALSLVLNLTAKSSLKLENIALSENIFSSIIGAMNSLLNALDARDTYTKDHSHRVTQYAVEIAQSMGCKQEVIDSINFAGPLHDIGKIGVRDDILLKKGGFTGEERDIMMSHVVRGEEILRPLNLLASEKAVVLYHHERWDGGGYPMGLSGQEIPIVARIFSVADTFDAMTSTRPYRQALSLDVAKDEIIKCRGSQFDPEVVDAFMTSGILKG